MLRDTLLSGRSSSGTCARFEAHSSAAGLHPAPAHASGHTPQRQVFIRHLRLLRGTLLSGPLLPRVARRGLAAAAEYLSEREADAVAEAGDGRGVSRHPACGIARVRPKNAGTMPLRQNGREASGNECGRGLCVLLQSRGFPPERMSRRETGWEVPPNAVAAGCLVRVSKQPIVMRLNGIRPATPRSASLAAALFCAFIPHTARNVRQHRTQTTTGSRCNPARLSLNPAIGRERTPAQSRNDKPAPGKGGSTYPDRRTGTG